MSSTSGGRWLFSTTGTGTTLGINNGSAPVFPFPVPGNFNMEVFTNATVNGLPAPPNPDPGFQTSIADVGGTLDSGFLTGANLRLASGNFLAVDYGDDTIAGKATTSGGISASKITLGTGNQTVVGAKGDTLVGTQNTGFSQILDGQKGFETIVGGASSESIWGGQNDSIVAGSAVGQQITTKTGSTVVAGIAGSATILLAANTTVTALPGGTQNVGIAAGANDLINLTGNSGLDFVIGATGDTVTGGSGTTNVEASAGGMLINVGAGGTTFVSGGISAATGNTVLGGNGALNFNPSAAAGKGDLINLSGSSGTATINAFAFGTTTIAAADTIFGNNSADSVFGGHGDRIGTGNGSVVGGTHQWTADSVAGSSVGFGSNDTVNSTTYVGNTATRGTVAGTSSAVVTVGGFAAATVAGGAGDFLFYQNENNTTNANIVATSQQVTVGGAVSTFITLLDGTVMTLVGVSQAQLQTALGIGTLFK